MNVSKVEAEKEDPEQVRDQNIGAEETKSKERSRQNYIKIKSKTDEKLNLEKAVGEKFNLEEAESTDVANIGLQDEDVQPLGGEKSTDQKLEVKTVENEVIVSSQAIGSTAQLSEAELLRICWKDCKSLAEYRNSLCKFLGLMQDVTVTEMDNSKEVLFKFPSKKKLLKVLRMMSKKGTNSLEKLKVAMPRVELIVSKFFKKKYGLLFAGKKAPISQVKKDFAKYGEVEIEVRSQVCVLWFDSKMSFYKTLTDPRTAAYKLIPCVLNFKFSTESAPIKPQVSVTKEFMMKATIEAPPVEESQEIESVTSFMLTEREIFGFIWKNQRGKTDIRDDQVISRQLTNFIKNVQCQGLSVDEDGLSVTFSSLADLTAALVQFCSSPVPDMDQLSSMSRKFTLLPSKGFFGLFSVRKVKPEHFSRFGDCQVRNCGIWFADKLSLFNVLRDPFISKTYPALFIDCRNIYILSSNKSLLTVQTDDHEKPVASSALKSTCYQGVLTRSATARLSTGDADTHLYKQEDDPIHITHPPNTKLVSTDPAVVTAVTSPSQPVPCPLLATLLPVDPSLPKPGLKLTKDAIIQGKFGHIPSARLVRTGYKQSKMPGKIRSVAAAELFLEDKNCYRSKDIKEAANLIINILQGRQVEGDTLRELKMRRVEHFLKDKLGVECRLTKEGKEKQAVKMAVDNDGEEDDAFKAKGNLKDL